MTAQRNYFDRGAQTYPISIGDTYTQARKWQLVESNLPKNGLVMDVGSATGRHALKINKDNVTVVAIDSSYEMMNNMMQSVQSSTPNRPVLPCNAALPDLPFSPGSFDTIYCFSTLLLLPSLDQTKALLHMAKLLKNDGTLIVDVANSWSLGLRYWDRHYRKKGLPGVFGYSKQNIHQLFEQAGLQIALMEPHGILTQLLLFPGLDRIKLISRVLKGTIEKKGWDATASAIFPYFAERWYIVARYSGKMQANVAEIRDNIPKT